MEEYFTRTKPKAAIKKVKHNAYVQHWRNDLVPLTSTLTAQSKSWTCCNNNLKCPMRLKNTFTLQIKKPPKPLKGINAVHNVIWDANWRPKVNITPTEVPIISIHSSREGNSRNETLALLYEVLLRQQRLFPSFLKLTHLNFSVDMIFHKLRKT